MRFSCAIQGRTRSPRSTSSNVRSICTVACVPWMEMTLTTPTVLVCRASVRFETGWTMGPSGRKISSLSPTLAGTSCLKRAYPVSQVESICLPWHDAELVAWIDPVRVFDARVQAPDLGPVPGIAEELLGEIPERVALDDGVLLGRSRNRLDVGVGRRARALLRDRGVLRPLRRHR